MRTRSRKETESSTEAAPVTRAASSRLVLSLIRQSNETKTRMQSEAGTLGEAIKHGVENGHLHAAALKVIARLARMDELKRNDFRRALAIYDDYAVEGGLFSGGQGDLMDRANGEAGEEDDGGAENAREVAQLEVS